MNVKKWCSQNINKSEHSRTFSSTTQTEEFHFCGSTLAEKLLFEEGNKEELNKKTTL